MTLEQVFPIALNFSPVSVILPTVNTYLHLHVALTRTEVRNLGTFHTEMLFQKSRSTEYRSNFFLTRNDKQRAQSETNMFVLTLSEWITSGLHTVSKVPQKGHNANVEYFCRNLINKDGSSYQDNCRSAWSCKVDYSGLGYGQNVNGCVDQRSDY